MLSQETNTQEQEAFREEQAQAIGYEERPTLSFGLIADIQYADDDDGHNFDRSVIRRYRNAMLSVDKAVEAWDAKVAFVGQLGDVIDGRNNDGRSQKAVEAVMGRLRKCQRARAYLDDDEPEWGALIGGARKAPIANCVGNHELYNFGTDLAFLTGANTRPYFADEAPRSGSADGSANEAKTEQDNFFSFVAPHNYGTSPARSLRVVVLDPYDIGMIGKDQSGPKYKRAIQLLKQHNPNDIFDMTGKVDWAAGLTGLERRWLPYNGAVGKQQLDWFRGVLSKAARAGERVVVLSHVGLSPGCCGERTLLWNYEEVLECMHEVPKGVVVACFTGHDHKGGYELDAYGIHHVTLQSPLEAPLHGVAYGTAHFFPNRIELEGKGTVPSRTLLFATDAKPEQTKSPKRRKQNASQLLLAKKDKYDGLGRGGTFFEVVQRIGKVSQVPFVGATRQRGGFKGVLHRSCLPCGTYDRECEVREVWEELAPSLIVCFITPEEMAVKASTTPQDLYKGLKAEILCLNIYTCSSKSLLQALQQTATALERACNVILHCSGGIGRTGLFVSLLMRVLGQSNVTQAQCSSHALAHLPRCLDSPCKKQLFQRLWQQIFTDAADANYKTS